MHSAVTWKSEQYCGPCGMKEKVEVKIEKDILKYLELMK